MSCSVATRSIACLFSLFAGSLGYGTVKTLNVGDFPAGKTLTIRYEATVRPEMSPRIRQVSGQAIISASNLPGLVSQDPSSGPNSETVTDISPCELPGNGIDCNNNGQSDNCDIATGVSRDCNSNGIPDECDIQEGVLFDCNLNGIADDCDLLNGTASDCDGNGLLDECDVTTTGAVLFSENFEAGLDRWTTEGLWRLAAAEECTTGSTADTPLIQAAYSRPAPDCDYNTGAATSGALTLAEDISLPTGLHGARLAWHQFAEMEDTPGKDLYVIQVSIDGGGSWNTVYDPEGDTQPYWAQRAVDLSAYVGHDIRLRFLFDSVDEVTNQLRGWHLDDIAIVELHATDADCNENRIPDECDLLNGTAVDCNSNGVIDSCEASLPAYAVSATPMSVTGAEDQDLVIELQPSSESETTFTTQITSLPTSGTLYQYSSGERGPAITSVPTIVSDEESHRVLFAPAMNEFGAVYSSFIYGAVNCAQESTATVTVDIEPVNDAPVLTVPASVQSAGGATTLLTGIAVSDVDAGTSPLQITIDPGIGFVSLETTEGLTILEGTGINDSRLLVEGPITALNSALATLTYSSDACQSGADLVVVQAADLGATGAGGLQMDVENIHVLIAPKQIQFESFSDFTGLQLNGTAEVTTDMLRLSSTSSNMPGSAWSCVMHPIGHGFSTSFNFQITNNGTEGGEGFAFVLQQHSNSALGATGSGLGYSGIPKSVAVAFDTHDPENPTLNRVSIQTRGNNPNSSDPDYSVLSTDLTNINLADGVVHSAWIDYDPVFGLSVYIDDLTSPILSAPINLGAILQPLGAAATPINFQPSPVSAHIGFTASTGGTTLADHNIINWQYEASENNTVPNGTLAGVGFETDGSGSQVTYDSVDNHSFGTGQEFTLEFWARPDSASPDAVLVSKGSNVAPSEAEIPNPVPTGLINYRVRQLKEGYLAFEFTDADGSRLNQYRTDLPVFFPGIWAHIAVVFEFGDPESIRVFVDGDLVTGAWIEGDGSDAPAVLTGSLVSSGESEGGNFIGVIDELRIWNAARTQEQIKDANHRRLLPPENDLVSNIRFDDFFLTPFITSFFVVEFPDATDLSGGCWSPNPIFGGTEAAAITSGAEIPGGVHVVRQGAANVQTTLSGFDADGDPLIAYISTLPTSGTLYQAEFPPAALNPTPGTPIISAGTTVTDSLMRVYYVPDGTAEVDYFWFRVTDGRGVSDETTVTILNYNLLNDPPQLSVPGRVTAKHDQSRSISGLSVSDADAGTSELSVTLETDSGSLTIPTTAGLSFSEGDGSGDIRMSFTGTLDTAINSALAGLIYTPAPGFLGLDTVTVTVNDLGHSGSGGPQETRASFTVEVINEAPFAGLAGAAFNAATTSYIEVPDPRGALDRNLSSSLTVEAWVNPASFGEGAYTILSNGATTGSLMNYALLDQNGYLSFNFMTTDSMTHRYESDAAVITPSNWTHVAASFTFGDPNSIRLYANGVQVPGSWVQGTGEGAPETSEEPLWIGGSGIYSSYNGQFDEVRIWNVIRPASEISEYMNEPLPFSDPRLSGYWHLDEGSGIVVADSSQSGLTGYIIGEPEAEATYWIASGPFLNEVTTLRNTDVTIPAAGFDADADLLIGRINKVPDNGTLYQFEVDGPGDAITSAGTSIEDWNRRIVYSPNMDEAGDPLDLFAYGLSDPFAESTSAPVSVRVLDPTIRVVGVTVDDFGPGGNSNGLLDPNECASLWVTLENNSVTTVSGVSTTLGPFSSEVAVRSAESIFPDMATGTTATNVVAFEIFTSPELTCTSEGLLLQMELLSNQGTALLTVPVTTEQLACPGTAAGCPAPFLLRDLVSMDDSQGNGDGDIDVNERFDVIVNLKNIGLESATSIRAEVVSETANVYVIAPFSPYEDIAPTEVRPNEYSFRLYTSDQFICGTPVNLRMTVTTNEGVYSIPVQLQSGVAQPPLLFRVSPNQTIPQADLVGASIEIPVSGITSSVGSVSVSTFIESPDVSGLSIALISPAGTTVTLYAASGAGANLGTGCPADEFGISFADTATTSIQQGSAPYADTFIPLELLSTFSGLSAAQANGIWTLQVTNSQDLESTVGCAALIINPSTVCETILDESAPSVLVGPVLPDPRNAPVDVVSITFSEPVLGFSLEDMVLTRNGMNIPLPGAQQLSTNNGETFELSGLFAETQLDGTYELTIVDTGDPIRDTSGNLLEAIVPDSWIMDTISPTVEVLDVVPDPRNTSVTSLTVIFSEPVTDVTLEGVALTRDGFDVLTGAESWFTTDSITWELGDVSSATSATGVYEFTVSRNNPRQQAAQVLSLFGSTIVDLAGNRLANTDSTSWTADLTAPAAPVITVPTSGTLTNDSTPIVEGTAEADSQVIMTVDGVPVTTVSASAIGEWSTILPALSEGEHILAAVASDSFGNTSEPSEQVLLIVDLTGPNPTLSTSESNPTSITLLAFTVTFDEAVTGLDAADVITSNGTVQIFSGSESLFNFEVAADGEGTVSVSIPAGVAVDEAGNPNQTTAELGVLVDVTSPTVQITPVVPDPRNSPVAELQIVFSEPVYGFDLSDLSLHRDGGLNLLTGGETLSEVGDTTFTVSGLAGLTSDNGIYDLVVATTGSEIADFAGNPLDQGTTETWRTDSQLPSVSILPVSPDPRNSAVDSVTIVFSEPVLNFDLADLTLTRDGGSNLLTGGELLTTSDETTYVLSGLAALTSSDGTYEIHVAPSDIVDSSGNSLIAEAVESWSADVTAPSVLITLADENPTSASMLRFNVLFSEDVDPTFSTADVTLIGSLAPLGSVSISGAGTDYVVTVSLSDADANGDLGIQIGTGVNDALGNTLESPVDSDRYQVLNAAFADLVVEKSADNSVVTNGEIITYTLVVTNLGPDAATSVTLTDPLDPSVTYFDATASQGTVETSGSTVVSYFGSLEPNTSATLLLSVETGQPGELLNSAFVEALEFDLVPGNNTDSALVDVLPNADLQVVQSPNLNPAYLMEPLTFNLTVTNNGPDSVGGITLTDNLPATVTNISAAVSQGTWSVAGPVVTAQLGTLQPGATAMVSVTVTPTELGTVSSSASVTSGGNDPVTGNNSVSTAVSVIARVTVIHTETFGEEPVWEPFGNLYPKLSYSEYDAGAGALKGYVGAAENRLRVAGWRSLNWNAFPYSEVGPDRFVRGKFSVYTGGQSEPGRLEEIPGMRLRLSHRFAQTSILDIFPHVESDPGNLAAADLRPSADPGRPSVYRVDFDPIDVPLLQQFGDTEGVMMAFEAFSTEADEYGFIALTEVELGTYPASALPLTEPPAKVYAPTQSDAGNLSLTLPEALVLSSTMVWADTPGGMPYPAPPEAGSAAHHEGSFGVTLDTTSVASDAISYMQREFDPGDLAQRVRVEAGKQYAIRFHVTSTQNSSENTMLYMKARSAKFGWVQKTLVGGAWAAGPTNSALAQQMLPGIGSQNPDRIGSENGGWYTVLMYTPLSKDVRADMDQSLSLSELMPHLAAEPGPGEVVPSLRDLKVGADVLDTFTFGPNAGLESASFTIDRIEVRIHDAVLD